MRSRIRASAVADAPSAAVAAAFEVGARPEFAGQTIVTIIPDFAEGALSTALFEGLNVPS